MALQHVLSVCAAASCAGLSLAQTPWLAYDASEGTLPTRQGFQLMDDQSGAAPLMRSGVLEQGPTSFEGQQYFHANHTEIDFDRGVLIRASVNVLSSTYRLAECAGAARFGYYLGAVDRLGRIAYVGMSDDKLFVLTSGSDVPSNVKPIVTIPMRGQWRELNMQIRSTGIDLYADGRFLAHYPLGPAGVTGNRNRVIFGDGTACGSSRVQMAWAEFGPVFECVADFNDDGFVDFSDYDAFVECFEGFACPPGKTADVNDDGFVDYFDYDAFVEVFEWGCSNTDGGGGSGGGAGDGGGGGAGNGSGGSGTGGGGDDGNGGAVGG